MNTIRIVCAALLCTLVAAGDASGPTPPLNQVRWDFWTTIRNWYVANLKADDLNALMFIYTSPCNTKQQVLDKHTAYATEHSIPKLVETIQASYTNNREPWWANLLNGQPADIKPFYLDLKKIEANMDISFFEECNQMDAALAAATPAQQAYFKNSPYQIRCGDITAWNTYYAKLTGQNAVCGPKTPLTIQRYDFWNHMRGWYPKNVKSTDMDELMAIAYNPCNTKADVVAKHEEYATANKLPKVAAALQSEYYGFRKTYWASKLPTVSAEAKSLYLALQRVEKIMCISFAEECAIFKSIYDSASPAAQQFFTKNDWAINCDPIQDWNNYYGHKVGKVCLN